MNEQLEDIYREVLVEGHKIKVVRQEGNKFHVVTWYHHPPMAEAAKKMGLEEHDLLSQTAAKDFILQDDD